MIALIDSDIVAYRVAAASENETVEVALLRADELMRRILHETDATEYKAYLSGSDNFRKQIYPAYKANRDDKPRPKYLQAVREFLVTEWKASVCDGIEADDALGIEQSRAHLDLYLCEFRGLVPRVPTIICSIDKDLLQIEGQHYNFVKQSAIFVDRMQGLRNFYTQLIMGDRSDNIPGFDGKMRQTVPKFLQSKLDELYLCETEWEMFEMVREMYGDDEKLLVSGQCLYIQRKENDLWRFPERENKE